MDWEPTGPSKSSIGERKSLVAFSKLLRELPETELKEVASDWKAWVGKNSNREFLALRDQDVHDSIRAEATERNKGDAKKEAARLESEVKAMPLGPGVPGWSVHMLIAHGKVYLNENGYKSLRWVDAIQLPGVSSRIKDAEHDDLLHKIRLLARVVLVDYANDGSALRFAYPHLLTQDIETIALDELKRRYPDGNWDRE